MGHVVRQCELSGVKKTLICPPHLNMVRVVDKMISFCQAGQLYSHHRSTVWLTFIIIPVITVSCDCSISRE